MSAAAAPAEGTLFPCSFGQESLWLLDRLNPGTAAYHVPLAWRVRGPLRTGALRAALTLLTVRHEVLRTALVEAGGRPWQRVLRPAPVPLAMHDLRDLAPAEREARAARLAREHARAPFDLAEGRPLRAAALRLEEEAWLVLVNVHHAAFDGGSLPVFTGELAAAYGAALEGGRPDLPPPPVQYVDYAAWQREWLSGDTLETLLGFWRGRLAGALPVLRLPGAAPRPADGRAPAATALRRVHPAVAAALPELARAAGATPFMLYLAAFQAVLGRTCGTDDVPVGVPAAGRPLPELQALVGLFANTLVLRGDLSGGPSFRALLERVRAATVDALAHDALPFEKVVEALGPGRAGGAPLVQASFDYAAGPLAVPALPGLEVAADGAMLENGEAKFDLSMRVTDTGGGMEVFLQYDRSVYGPPVIDRLLDDYLALLAAVAADPGRPLAELVLPPARRDAVPVPLAAAAAEAEVPEEDLAARFAACAAQAPGAPALRLSDGVVTYAELDARVEALAVRLRAHGAAPERLVALRLPRSSPDAVVAMLAVLRAGAAFVELMDDDPLPRGVHRVLRAGAEGIAIHGRDGTEAVEEEAGAPRERASADPRPLPGSLAWIVRTA
ncbi:MAG TPA: condensation domain-containing protein, partial [Longimicrobium sp.]|nr:condensation domain-containing protein [Longimicrobium sp.]